jgi:hypothetical protein
MGEPWPYLVATSRLNGFAHLKHLKLDNFVFGVTFAMISNKLVSIELFTRRYRFSSFCKDPQRLLFLPSTHQPSWGLWQEEHGQHDDDAWNALGGHRY